MNLLGPQDKRAKEPGDRKEIVLARRRTLERGLGESLLSALHEEISTTTLLDVGCGEGYYTGHLQKSLACEAWGVDISSSAVDHAARRWPRVRWVAANGDRRLPFADGAFDVILSNTGPKNAVEFRRLLTSTGRLFVVTSAPDDLQEFRAAVLGQAIDVDRTPRIRELFLGPFTLASQRDVRHQATLDHDALVDLVAGTYRAARHRERAALDRITSLAVTLSWRIHAFR